MSASVADIKRALERVAGDPDVQVNVNRGAVYLRGTVPTMDGAESVEEVAFRVEGVVDVYDQLKISELS
jgi:osmotically-inducible protein OsmY